jgi:hypothetical protein
MTPPSPLRKMNPAKRSGSDDPGKKHLALRPVRECVPAQAVQIQVRQQVKSQENVE